MSKLPNISSNHIKKYHEELLKFASSATIDRKIVALKKFFTWLKEEGYLAENPIERFLKESSSTPLPNPNYARGDIKRRILSRFEKHKRLHRAVYHTLYTRPKWYIRYHASPLSNYFNWAILIIFCALISFGAYDQFFAKSRGASAFPTTLTRPSRYLSFQGRLTNATGSPITTSTNIVFKLYDAASSGSQLWTSGTCAITPDTDGIFSTLLGSSCGTELTSDIFSQNAGVWAGVTVSADAEATPRIQIATVAYALNSETLQGFPASASATANTVPVINNSGQMVLAYASPKIQSTSGTFAVEGQAITIQTPSASNGNVTIAPDGTGQLNLTFAGASAGSGTGMVNATDANLTSTALYYGAVASNASGYNLLQLQSGSSLTDKYAIDYAGNSSQSGTLTFGGTATIQSTNFSGLTLGGTTTGNITLSPSNDIAGGNVSPNVTNVTDLGTSSKLFRNIYGTTLYQGAYQVCDSNGTGCPAGSTNYWGQTLGAIYPLNNQVDLLLGATAGATATTSAKFAFTGVNSGTPTASISGTTNIATFIDGNGNISSTNRNNLVLGNSATYNTTGNILLNPNGTGNVGVGTTAPQSALTLGGSGTIVNGLTFGTANTGFYVPSATGLLYFMQGGTQVAQLYTNGIGGYAGGSGEMVNVDSTATVPNLIPDYGDTNTGIGAAGSDILSLIAGGTNGLNVNSSGNVGIGTTSPTAKLDIKDTATTTGSEIYATASAITSGNILKLGQGGNTNFTGNVIYGDIDNTGQGGIGFTGNFLKFDNATATKYTLDSSGNSSQSGTLTFGGTATIQSTASRALTLGGATTGNIVLSALNDIAGGNISPNVTNVSDLGTSSKLFRNIYGTTLYQGANQVCDAGGGVSGCPTNYWQLNTLTLSPANNTYDLAIGGTATSSAKFQVFALEKAGDATSRIEKLNSSLITTGTLFEATASAITSGNIIKLGQGGDSAFSGTGLWMDFDNTGGGGGTFTGNFLKFDNATATKFTVASTGNITTAGDLAVNGNDITSGGDLTITPAGGQVIFADTDTINIGGLVNVAYNAFANAADTPASTAITADNDLFVGGDLEVKGGLYLTGKNIYNVVGGVSTGAITLAADPITVNNYNSLGYGSWLVDNQTNPGIAALMVNQGKGGDIFTASASGVTKLTINTSGNIDSAGSASISGNLTFKAGASSIQTTASNALTIGGATTGNITLDPLNHVAGGYIAPNTTNVSDLGTASLLFRNIYGTNLYQGANQVCDVSGANCPFWNQDLGALFAKNNTVDLLLGSSATASAKFAFTGVNSGTPTASISGATNIAMFMDGNGNISSTNRNNLVLGNSATYNSTGNILLNPNGTGNVGIGITTPSTALDIARDDATNNDITNLLTLTHTTSGTAASRDGFTPDTAGTLTTNLISFWNMDDSGTRKDNFSSNDLTSSGSPGTAQGIRGLTADLVAASSQFLYRADNAALSTGDINFSISTWVKLTSKSANMTIVSKSDSSSVREYELQYNTSSDRFVFTIENSGGTVCNATANNFGAVSTGTWINIVVWHDATANTCNIQVNNGTADSAGETGVASDTAATFRIGARFTTTAKYFDGRIDATGFWKKVLSSTEITDLYNTGAGSQYLGSTTGIGSAVLFKNENDAGNAVNSGRITSYLTTATNGSEGSSMAFETRSAGQNLVKNMRLNATGDLYLNGSLNAQSNPDIAENIFVTDPSIEGGDIVMIDPTFIPPTNDNIYNNFAGKKSDEPYSQKLIGIISTNPGIVLNATKGSVDTGVVSQENERPMAISGRVPVKISASSAQINIGDPITASADSGRGMKATQEGKIVGTALENWSPSSPTDKILVLISNSYYNPELNIGSTGDLMLSGNPVAGYQISASTGIINKVGAFADLVVANVKAGYIETQNLATTSFTAFQGTIDNLLVKSGLVATNIQTKLISPLADSTDITFKLGSEATPSGKLAIQNINGDEVASIDNAGNATFSGTLYADEIKSKSLDEIQELLTKVQVDQDLLKESANWNTNTATDSAKLDQLAVLDLYVTNQAAINSLSVSTTLSMGSDMVLGLNTLDTLSAPLKIQSLAMAPVEIMAGLIKIDTQGNMQIAGNLNVAGKITAPEAAVNDLTIQNLTIATGNIASESAQIATGDITTNATAGSAIIPAGVTEITISNPKVTDYTLVYVTPTSSTQNNVLYVKSKENGKFVVGFANAIDTDTQFNWWIIEVK